MKKIKFLLGGLILATFLVSCASTQVAETQTPKKKVQRYQREIVDWTGAKTGGDVPEWFTYADQDDEEGLLDSDDLEAKLSGKYWIVQKVERQTKDINSKNLRMAQELCDATYMTGLGRTLNAAVDARFSGALSANEDSQKTLTATAANARFTGFKRVKDGYVLSNVTDTKTGKETMTYEVIRIYACDEDLWQQQAANYIRQLGLNSESEDLKKASSMADELATSIKPGFDIDTDLEE